MSTKVFFGVTKRNKRKRIGIFFWFCFCEFRGIGFEAQPFPKGPIFANGKNGRIRTQVRIALAKKYVVLSSTGHKYIFPNFFGKVESTQNSAELTKNNFEFIIQNCTSQFLFSFENAS